MHVVVQHSILQAGERCTFWHFHNVCLKFEYYSYAPPRLTGETVPALYRSPYGFTVKLQLKLLTQKVVYNVQADTAHGLSG